VGTKLNVGDGRKEVKVMKLEDTKHPMQPIGLDEHGSVKFKQNAIVRFLLDAGPFDLNQISMMPFPNEDYTHLMQLIGYTTSGYGELGSSPKELVRKADKIADDIYDKAIKIDRVGHGCECGGIYEEEASGFSDMISFLCCNGCGVKIERLLRKIQ